MQDIIADRQRGMSNALLGEKYGVTERTIRRRIKQYWEELPPPPPVDYKARCAELEEALNKLVSEVDSSYLYQPQDTILTKILQDKSESEISTAIEINLRQHYLEEVLAQHFKDLRRVGVGVGDALKTLSEGYDLPVAKARRMICNRLGNISTKYDIFKDEIVEAYRNGASTRELGFQWNTTTDVMRRQLRAWGVSDTNRLKKKRIRHNHIDQLPMLDIIADYKANMSIVKLCQKYYVGERFLKKCLKQMGVPMRPPRSSNVGANAPTPQPQPLQNLSDTLALVIADYKAGTGIVALSKRYNLSKGSIKRALEQAGVELRRAGRPVKV